MVANGRSAQGGFRKCSTDLIVLLEVDDDNLTALAMPLIGCARWQSLSNVLPLVVEHGCSAACQQSDVGVS